MPTEKLKTRTLALTDTVASNTKLLCDTGNVLTNPEMISNTISDPYIIKKESLAVLLLIEITKSVSQNTP